MKQVFEEPQMQVIKFLVKDDIVTTSPDSLVIEEQKINEHLD